VINLSISTTVDDPALRSAIADALTADIVVIAAVGNGYEQGNPRPYPASYPGVVGVGAIGPDGLRVESSQVGAYVDLTAPGAGVVGAAPGGGQQTYEGTSFAAPFVAATAALVRARWPALHQAEVVHRLLATADPATGPRPSPQYGYGVVNPLRALTEVVASLPSASAPASPGVGPPPAPPVRTRPNWLVIGFALALVLAAIAIAVIAAAVPAGRRRRWRPGEPAPLLRPPPATPPADPHPRVSALLRRPGRRP
jgi:subtilisin family serine protease